MWPVPPSSHPSILPLDPVGIYFLFLHTTLLSAASGTMSVTVSKADGVTVLTMVSDPNGRLPPLCQVLKALSHSLGGCSEPPHMKRLQRASLLVLGVSKKLMFFQNAWFTCELIAFILPKSFLVWFFCLCVFWTDEDLGWWSLRYFCLGCCSYPVLPYPKQQLHPCSLHKVTLSLCGLDFVVRAASRHQSCLGWVGPPGAAMEGLYLPWVHLCFLQMILFCCPQIMTIRVHFSS